MAKIRNMIAFDLGASNGRAILGRFDGEKITMTELHRFENNYIEMNGIFYWDTPYLYAQLKQGLLNSSRAVTAIWIPSVLIPGVWTSAFWIKTGIWLVFPVPTDWAPRRILMRSRKRSPRRFSIAAAVLIPH